MTYTDRDARQFIIEALNGQDVADFNMEAMMVDMFDAANNSWDLSAISEDDFWHIVQRHDRTLA